MTYFFPPPNSPGIFSTREWVDAWQEAWASSEAIHLASPCFDGEVPRYNFYQYRQKKQLFLKFSTLFSAGISTNVSRSLRSEYFMLNGVSADAFIAKACCYSWDQFFVPDILANSNEHLQLKTAAEAVGLTVLVRDTSSSYAVRLHNNSFANYLSSISSSVRLKIFNKRKKLYQVGNISTKNMWPNIDNFIEILNEFHVLRWGKPCFEGRNRQQITSFLNKISLAGGVPDLSVIYYDERPISVVLDLYYRQRIYNIQSGYMEKFQDGISLGTLHLGIQVEKAFSSDAYFYDFMAGNGKNSNYKKSISTDSEHFVSLMLVRSPVLKILYRMNDTWLRFKSTFS